MIVTNTLFISIAYKAAALQLMLGEANYFSRNLSLPTPHPIQVTDVKKSYVSPPRFGFGGTIETTNFLFAFYQEGILYDVCRMENGENYLAVSKYEELAVTPSLLNGIQAYQLATQWLTAVSVDVVGLERKHKAIISQQPFHYPRSGTNVVLLPIYYVSWGEGDTPPVRITLLGTTKELMELRLEDSSFSRRPPLVVTNAWELNSIPDPPVKQLQRVPQESSANALALTNPPSTRPPPFRREIKKQ